MLGQSIAREQLLNQQTNLPTQQALVAQQLANQQANLPVQQAILKEQLANQQTNLPTQQALVAQQLEIQSQTAPIAGEIAVETLTQQRNAQKKQLKNAKTARNIRNALRGASALVVSIPSEGVVPDTTNVTNTLRTARIIEPTAIVAYDNGTWVVKNNGLVSPLTSYIDASNQIAKRLEGSTSNNTRRYVSEKTVNINHSGGNSGGRRSNKKSAGEASVEQGDPLSIPAVAALIGDATPVTPVEITDEDKRQSLIKKGLLDINKPYNLKLIRQNAGVNAGKLGFKSAREYIDWYTEHSEKQYGS